MRIEKRTREVKPIDVSVITTICDMCKRDVKAVEEDDDGISGTQDIEISASIGVNKHYEGGDQRDFYKIDCCHECFLKKVIPLFRNQGVEFTKKNIEYRYSPDTGDDQRHLGKRDPVPVETEMYVFAHQQGNGTLRYFEVIRAGIGFKWVPSITTDCLLTKEQVQACLALYPVLQQARALRCNLFRENP